MYSIFALFSALFLGLFLGLILEEAYSLIINRQRATKPDTASEIALSDTLPDMSLEFPPSFCSSDAKFSCSDAPDMEIVSARYALAFALQSHVEIKGMKMSRCLERVPLFRVSNSNDLYVNNETLKNRISANHKILNSEYSKLLSRGRIDFFVQMHEPNFAEKSASEKILWDIQTNKFNIRFVADKEKIDMAIWDNRVSYADADNAQIALEIDGISNNILNMEIIQTWINQKLS